MSTVTGWWNPPASCCPLPLYFSCHISECPQGREGDNPPQAAIAHRSRYILWLQRLFKGCSAVPCSSECLCECGVVPHSLVLAPLVTTSSWAAAGAGIFAGRLKESSLECTKEWKADPWAECVQQDPFGHWILCNDLNPLFSIKSQAGREGEQRRKEKISCSTIQRMWLGRNESLLKAVIKVVHLCNQSQ